MLSNLVLILALMACSACSIAPTPIPVSPSASSTGTLPVQSAAPGAGPTPAPHANLSDVNALAHQVYSQVQAGQDVKPLLAGIFESFGIPVLSEASSASQGLALIKSGKPAIFDAQVAAMDQGFTNGVLVDLKSLLADLAAHGVTATVPAGPLTADYLNNAMAYLTSKTSFTPQETLPALIITLGQARAAQLSQKNVDPVWGDGYLDPLQYLLLAYGVSFSGLQPVAQAASILPLLSGLSEPAMAEGSPSLFEKFLKLLDPSNVPGYIICGLYLIENSQFSLQIDPAAVYHEQGDISNPPPYQTTITGTLSISSDPSPQVRDLLTLSGCSVPPNKGPLKDKTVGWTLDSVAQQHGSLTSTDNKTKEDGMVKAVYETIAEVTPQAGRIPAALQQVQGEIQATVLDLVDGHENLSAIIRLLGSTEKTNWVYPDIKFYGSLALDIAGSYQIPGRDATVTNVITPQTIVLSAGTGGALTGSAAVPLTSSATFNCGSGGTVQAKGAFTGKFQVLLKSVGSADSGQLALQFIPDLSLLKPPVANSRCVAGDLNDVAWAGIVTLLTAKVTFTPSAMTYSFTPSSATGSITFTLHAVK